MEKAKGLTLQSREAAPLQHLGLSNMTFTTGGIVIIMGVSGSGKSTIGQQLAHELGWSFRDGDDFHSPQNIAKMQQGQALTDADRAPWLAAMKTAIQTWHQTQQPTILACSALKASYRQQLTPKNVPVQWVYLHGTFKQIQQRLMQRQQQQPEHFMGAQLLHSQFEALEEPEEALWVGVRRSPTDIIHTIKTKLEL